PGPQQIQQQPFAGQVSAQRANLAPQYPQGGLTYSGRPPLPSQEVAYQQRPLMPAKPTSTMVPPSSHRPQDYQADTEQGSSQPFQSQPQPQVLSRGRQLTRPAMLFHQSGYRNQPGKGEDPDTAMWRQRALRSEAAQRTSGHSMQGGEGASSSAEQGLAQQGVPQGEEQGYQSQQDQAEGHTRSRSRSTVSAHAEEGLSAEALAFRQQEQIQQIPSSEMERPPPQHLLGLPLGAPPVVGTAEYNKQYNTMLKLGLTTTQIEEQFRNRLRQWDRDNKTFGQSIPPQGLSFGRNAPPLGAQMRRRSRSKPAFRQPPPQPDPKQFSAQGQFFQQSSQPPAGKTQPQRSGFDPVRGSNTAAKQPPLHKTGEVFPPPVPQSRGVYWQHYSVGGQEKLELEDVHTELPQASSQGVKSKVSIVEPSWGSQRSADSVRLDDSSSSMPLINLKAVTFSTPGSDIQTKVSTPQSFPGKFYLKPSKKSAILVFLSQEEQDKVDPRLWNNLKDMVKSFIEYKKEELPYEAVYMREYTESLKRSVFPTPRTIRIAASIEHVADFVDSSYRTPNVGERGEELKSNKNSKIPNLQFYQHLRDMVQFHAVKKFIEINNELFPYSEEQISGSDPVFSCKDLVCTSCVQTHRQFPTGEFAEDAM
ncbi:MAG: hypothetical protein GY820_24990, partial [Gammaproteobacteria bacterium]|nr:hypothetical protein [Gammaproteobacteria bacterium]